MTDSKQSCELSIYYQDKLYSWQELVQKKTQSIAAEDTDCSIALNVQAQDVFTTLLTLLYGFKQRRTVFPHSSESTGLASSDAALAIATSGSQAAPKIALLTRANIIAHCHSFVKKIPVDHSSIWLNCMPLNHIAGIMIIYRCWFNNAAMVLHEHFNSKKVWQDINHYAVSHISLVPRMLFRLLEHCQDTTPPESLSYVLVGGDRLSTALYKRAVAAGWPVYISYGMTEASSTIAIGRTPDKLGILDGLETQLTAKDVLKIRGDMVFEGYMNAPQKTQKEQWFVTHDKVKLENNYLTIIGRNDYVLIVGGENIAPECIEALFSPILEPEGFLSDIAIGKYRTSDSQELNDTLLNNSRGDIIVALCSCNPDCSKGEDDSFLYLKQLEHWIDNNIAPSKQPEIILQLNKIPRNSLGKIDRQAVQAIIDQHLPHLKNNTAVII